MSDRNAQLENVSALSSPWHEGELELQRHAGVADQMDTVGRKFVRHFLLISTANSIRFCRLSSLVRWMVRVCHGQQCATVSPAFCIHLIR